MRKLWPLMVPFIASACLSDTSPAPTSTTGTTTPTTSTTISIVPGSGSTLVGQTLQFVSSISGSSAPLTWSVSNATVGTISGAGLFTAMSPGTDTVTASGGGVSRSALVTVANGAVDRVLVCDRASGGCTSNVTLPPSNSTAVAVRASAYNAFGADISSTCVFQWTPLVAGILNVSVSTDAMKHDALLTRVAPGSVSLLVSCSGVVGIFTVS